MLILITLQMTAHVKNVNAMISIERMQARLDHINKVLSDYTNYRIPAQDAVITHKEFEDFLKEQSRLERRIRLMKLKGSKEKLHALYLFLKENGMEIHPWGHDTDGLRIAVKDDEGNVKRHNIDGMRDLTYLDYLYRII